MGRWRCGGVSREIFGRFWEDLDLKGARLLGVRLKRI